MRKEVHIMSGIGAVGKTTLCRKLRTEFETRYSELSPDNPYLPNTQRFSANDFHYEHPFLVEDGRGGKYNYDPRRLTEVHTKCLRHFVTAVTSEVESPELIAVDNTNLSATEIAPYSQLALAYGWETHLHIFERGQFSLKALADRGQHVKDVAILARQESRMQHLLHTIQEGHCFRSVFIHYHNVV